MSKTRHHHSPAESEDANRQLASRSNGETSIVAQQKEDRAFPAFADNRPQAAQQRITVAAIRQSSTAITQRNGMTAMGLQTNAATPQADVIQKAGLRDWGRAIGSGLGEVAGWAGALGGAMYGGVTGAVSGALGDEGVGMGAARGLVSGASLGYQRPGAALGALAGGIAGHAAGAVGAVGGGAAGLAAGLYQGGSVGAALAGAAAGAAGGYYLPVAGGAAAGAILGEALNEQVAPSLEPRGYEDNVIDTDGQDTEPTGAVATTSPGAAAAYGPIAEALDDEMPLSEFVRRGGDVVQGVFQLAAPFGGVSTNTYAVPETGKTHTVSYTRIGNGGINFNNPTSVAPAFGMNIQANGDKTNILFTYKGTEYIDYKPKGGYTHTWVGNEKARSLHFRAANVKRGYAGSSQPYPGWTWHHQLAPRGEMVPVLTNVHKRHNHNGGVFLW